MTRTVRDAALMFSAMARYDLRDPFAVPDDGRDWRDGIEDGRRRPARSACCGGLASMRRWTRMPSPRWNAPRRCWPMPARRCEDANPALPDTRVLFSRVWGVRAGAASWR